MKKIIIIGFLIFGYWAFGETISTLFQEFEARDMKKITAEQARAISFLKSIKYNTQNIVEIETLSSSDFIFRDRNEDICINNSLILTLRCKNKMGLTTVSFRPEVPFDETSINLPRNTVSKLFLEYQKRSQIVISDEAKKAFDFLKSIEYQIEDITQLEMLDEVRFVFRDKNMDVCLGDTADSILRCKNEMGLTGVSYQGDAD